MATPPPNSQSTDALREMALAGDSLPARRLRSQLQRIAPYFRTALIVGEHGLGEDAIAARLHEMSPVAQGPVVVCTAEELTSQPAEMLAPAQHGTLYVRALQCLSLAAQAVMVERLQELDRAVRARKVSTRVVAHSVCELRAHTTSGQFRQDLYSRLSVVEIRLTPLRERVEDIADLCEIALRLRQENGGGELRTFAADALDRLTAHHWARNLEELRETVDAALEASSGSRVIEVHHLPELNGKSTPAAAFATTPTIERLEDVLRRHVVDVLSRCAGNKVRAAELLGISRSTLYRMLDVAT